MRSAILEIISLALGVRYEGDKPVQFAIHFAELNLAICFAVDYFQQNKRKDFSRCLHGWHMSYCGFCGHGSFAIYAQIAPHLS